MTSPTESPQPPVGGSPDARPRQNQGIPYSLRNIQILDGLILAAIIAVFSSVQETDDKVDQLLAERKAEQEVQAKVEAVDPVVRKVRYDMELNAIRDHVKAVDKRVTELEADDRER